jgi:hypothetical protein
MQIFTGLIQERNHIRAISAEPRMEQGNKLQLLLYHNSIVLVIVCCVQFRLFSYMITIHSIFQRNIRQSLPKKARK